MGNFRKIHTIPQTAFQESKDRGGGGGGGHLQTGNLKAGGKHMSGILNPWEGGGVRSGISTGTDTSVFLENAFFMDLKSKA